MRKLLRLLRHDWPVHFLLWLTNGLPDNRVFLGLRGALVSPFLGSAQGNLRLARNVVLYNPSHIHLGSDVYIAYGCCFLAIGEIRIEDGVMFGPYAVLSAGNHTRRERSYRFGELEVLPIWIGKGTWVGAHCTVMGGAQIGQGCMVASNAAVARGTYPDDSLITGAPAKAQHRLDKGDPFEH